jgi:hypothetical protein
MPEYQQNPCAGIHNTIGGQASGDGKSPASTPFLDIVQSNLGNIRENILRATTSLADAGFYNDAGPTDGQQGSPDKPDITKSVQIVVALIELNTLANSLVQQVNKLA